MKRRTKVMKKNQGFSLVELIVVIAIMAILVGVLAPAYLRYVEKSRKSTDISAVDEMIGAADKVAVDPELNVPSGAKFTITLGATIQLSYAASDGDPATEWKKLAKCENGYTTKSTAWQELSGTFVGTVQDDGSVSWGYTGDASEMCAFSSSLAKKVGYTATSGD